MTQRIPITEQWPRGVLRASLRAMGMPAARNGDVQYCPTIGAAPHVGGPLLIVKQFDVIINGRFAARRTDFAMCLGDGSLNAVKQGSFSVFIHGQPAARQLDKMLHGGIILTGYPLVLIGDTSGQNGVGKSYPTAEDAARAAIDQYNKRSVEESREYCGVVYKNPDGTYGYTEATQGTQKECKAENPIPNGTKKCGDYHTHGEYCTEDCKAGTTTQTADPNNDDQRAEHFSSRDKRGYEDESFNQKTSTRDPDYRGYVGTPSGAKKEYNPSTKETRNF